MFIQPRGWELENDRVTKGAAILAIPLANGLCESVTERKDPNGPDQPDVWHKRTPIANEELLPYARSKRPVGEARQLSLSEQITLRGS